MNRHGLRRNSRVIYLLLAWLGATAARAIEVSVSLSTPRLTGIRVEIPVGESAAVLEASFSYDAKGKIIGEATVDGAAVSVKGKQTLSFKGSLQGSNFVGTLKVKAPPAKETLESFSIPVGVDFNLPDGGGNNNDDVGSEELIKYITLRGSDPSATWYGNVQVNKVTTSSGKVFKRAYASFQEGSNYYFGSDGVKFGIDAMVPPTQTGVWLTLPLFLYDINNPGHFIDKSSGTISVAVTAVNGETVSGTWDVNLKSGSKFSGTWQDPPAHGGF